MGPLPGVNVTIPICWSAGTGCADRATAGAGGFGGGDDALALALELAVAMGSAGEGSVSAEQAHSKGNVAPEARRASARARRDRGGQNDRVRILGPGELLRGYAGSQRTPFRCRAF